MRSVELHVLLYTECALCLSCCTVGTGVNTCVFVAARAVTFLIEQLRSQVTEEL